MPVIKLTWTEKQTKEEKRQFIEDVAEIVSSAIRVPSEIVNVLICELPKENVRFPEAVFTISWSRHPERNPESKKEIIRRITEKVLAVSDIKPEKIVSFCHDLPGEDVGVAGNPRT